MITNQLTENDTSKETIHFSCELKEKCSCQLTIDFSNQSFKHECSNSKHKQKCSELWFLYDDLIKNKDSAKKLITIQREKKFKEPVDLITYYTFHYLRKDPKSE